MNRSLNSANFPHLFFAGRTRLTLRNNEKGTHIRLKVVQKKTRIEGKLVGTNRFYLYTSILNDGDTGWDFAATFYPRGRQWLHAPWRAVRAQYRTAADQVVISKAVREQLRLWVTELGKPDHEGVPIGAAEAFPAAASSEVSAIYADAALECAGAGIRINAVCPGGTETPNFMRIMGDAHAMDTMVPMGRIGQPAEVAEAVTRMLLVAVPLVKLLVE
jgi:hypothetical protein